MKNMNKAQRNMPQLSDNQKIIVSQIRKFSENVNEFKEKMKQFPTPDQIKTLGLPEDNEGIYVLLKEASQLRGLIDPIKDCLEQGKALMVMINEDEKASEHCKDQDEKEPTFLREVYSSFRIGYDSILGILQSLSTLASLYQEKFHGFIELSKEQKDLLDLSKSQKEITNQFLEFSEKVNEVKERIKHIPTPEQIKALSLPHDEKSISLLMKHISQEQDNLKYLTNEIINCLEQGENLNEMIRKEEEISKHYKNLGRKELQFLLEIYTSFTMDYEFIHSTLHHLDSLVKLYKEKLEGFIKE